jgi:hypothetical protein
MRPRKAKTPVVLASALIALQTFACGTVYLPAPSPRIGLVIHHVGAWYVKDGRETAIGPLGGDLEALVASEPEARRFARRSRHELAVGVPAYVCGLAAVVVGLAIAKPAGWIVGGAGAVAAGTGVGLMGAGLVDAVDAVNVYNDHATAPHP